MGGNAEEIAFRPMHVKPFYVCVAGGFLSFELLFEREEKNMIDLKFLRENPEIVKENIKK